MWAKSNDNSGNCLGLEILNVHSRDAWTAANNDDDGNVVSLSCALSLRSRLKHVLSQALSSQRCDVACVFVLVCVCVWVGECL